MATSTPRPSVSRLISATTSQPVGSRVIVAPNWRDDSTTLGQRIHADDQCRTTQPGSKRRTQTDRSLGEHRHAVTDLHIAALCPGYAGGRDVRDHEDLLIRQVSGIGVRFARASGTRRYSAHAPLMVFPNLHPPIGP